MQFYVKIKKDGKQVFEGWNDDKSYTDFFDSIDDLTEYEGYIDDYDGKANCGAYLVDKNRMFSFDNLSDLLERLEKLDTAEDFYNDLNNTDEIFYDEYYDFDEDTINEIFKNPYDALRACFFGNVYFTDDYFKFDGYGNIKTVNEIPYDDYNTEIIERWIEENF